jgi:hypothetical protein
MAELKKLSLHTQRAYARNDEHCKKLPWPDIWLKVIALRVSLPLMFSPAYGMLVQNKRLAVGRHLPYEKMACFPNKVCSTIHTKFNGLLFKHNRKTSADRQISALLAENKLLEKSFLRCNQLDTRPKPGQNSFARIRNFLEQAFLVCPKIWRMLTPMASTSLLIYVPEPALGLGTSIKRTSGRFLPLMVPF